MEPETGPTHCQNIAQKPCDTGAGWVEGIVVVVAVVVVVVVVVVLLLVLVI